MQQLEQRIERIRNDREHGSRWLVRETILLLRDLATASASDSEEQMRQLQYAGNALARARPAMAALAGVVGRVLGEPAAPEEIARRAENLLRDYDTAIAQITGYARPLLNGILMTHSLSGTVLEVLATLSAQIREVIVLEGRPRCEGREVARELGARSIAVTLITDAQADIFLPRCDAVVVGADSILANGDILNKAGTALVAWAARGHSVPLYVLSETLKISSRSESGGLASLEEKEPEEVLEHPPAGVTVRNFYFDRTPASLVSAIITEQGALDSLRIQCIAASLRASIERFQQPQNP